MEKAEVGNHPSPDLHPGSPVRRRLTPDRIQSGSGQAMGQLLHQPQPVLPGCPVPEALPCSRRGIAEATQPQREGEGGRCIRGHTQKPRATVLCTQFL